MWAVLSCIHANLEALDAVLADIAKHDVSRVYCLGDVLGYGPNPIECLERAIKFDVTLLGNHDQAVMFDPVGFNLTAEQVAYWHRKVLESSGRNDLWEFLASCPRSFQVDDCLLVHGSPRNPLNEYIFPEDIYNGLKMTRIASKFRQYCFAGHTHVPGVFRTGPASDVTAEEWALERQRRPADEPEWQFLSPTECSERYRLDGRKTIINVGSVGQPRDGDWRAGYVLVDGADVIFRRVEYDVDTTVQKIYDIPELDDFLGDRLPEGR